MTAPGEFLHLASGPSAAGAIKETLRRLGRNETVIAWEDSFDAGPLGDVDAGGACRRDWYARIDPEALDRDDACQFDDSDLWERVRVATADVMLWHGPHPVERIFALRACWHLRAQERRVHEVTFPAVELRPKSRVRPAFYDAVGRASQKETAQAWDRRAKVVDVAARARRWEELRSQPGDWIRVLVGEDIVQLPVTGYDAEIMNACGAGAWTESRRIGARILAESPISLSVLVWRIRELIRMGQLECRGEDDPTGLPRELRLVL